MAGPGNREEEGGLWLTEEVGDRRIVESETDGSFKVTVRQLSNSWDGEATTGGAFARVKPSGDALVQCADGLTQDTFKICKEFLRPFKKCLRKLNLPKDLPEKKRLKVTRTNLIILGDHIDMFLQHYCKKWELKHWKRMLWRFVSLFSTYDERQLSKLYRYSKTNQMAKFLKTYGCLEGLGPLALSKNKGLKKLRNRWGLPGEEKTPEKLSQIDSLLPDCGQPTDNASKKWLHKTSSTPGRWEDVDQNEVMDNQPKSPVSTNREGQEVSSMSQEALSEMDP